MTHKNWKLITGVLHSHYHEQSHSPVCVTGSLIGDDHVKEPQNGYVQDAWRDIEDALLAPQLSELKEQLWQRDAAIADHNAKSQEQAAIIDTLIQHLSKMEDQLHIPHQKYMVDKMQHKVLSFQQENEQLIEHLEYLEDELSQTNKQVKELKSLLKRYMSERPDDFPTSESRHPTYFPNRKGTREMNVALLLAQGKKEVSRLPNSFAETKKEANFTNHKNDRMRRMDTY